MQCSDWRKAKKASILLYTIYTPCGKSGEKERKRVPACMCELSTITLTAHCASLVSTLCASTRGRSVPSSQYLCQVGLDSRPLLRPHWASVLSRDPISCYLIGCGRFATHPPHTTTYKRKLALDRQIYLRLKLGLLGTLKLAMLTLALKFLLKLHQSWNEHQSTEL